MILLVLQLIIGILLIVCVAVQMQGAGLSTAFGGGSGEFYRSKRSVERILYYATIVLAALFAIISLVLLYHK